TFSNSDFIEKVAGINRNGWPLSIRISGRFESESMATLDRNIQQKTKTLFGYKLHDSIRYIYSYLVK
ncbi:MAG: hypothetical protein AB1410_01485, partial [Acidobacteriota bacterium]